MGTSPVTVVPSPWVAAYRVLEKVGMRRLDVRPRHHLDPSGVLRDSVGFAIDREDVSLWGHSPTPLHKGELLLDELNEFRRDAIEALR